MIDLHPDETRAAIDAEPERTLFENAEWSVSAEGLEHRASGYFIARDVLGLRRNDLWEWPLHLAEKSWCRPRPFREAFLAALGAFDVAGDAGLAPSFAIGFGLTAGPTSRSSDDFVALGDLIRPKVHKPGTARKRSAVSETRGGIRRSGGPTPQPLAESGQRAAVSGLS